MLAHEAYESRRRLSERWALEVLPSLREARLPDLAAYEGALTDMERRRTEAQQLRLEAEKDDLQAAAASQAAASLEARRTELAALESQMSSVGAAVDMAAVEAFGGTLPAVRQRIDDGERRLEALKLRIRQGDDDAVRDATEKLKEQRISARCAGQRSGLGQGAIRRGRLSNVTRPALPPCVNRLMHCGLRMSCLCRLPTQLQV